MVEATNPFGTATFVIIARCDQGSEGLRTDSAEGDPYLLQPLGPPLEDEGHSQWVFLGATDPTIKSSIPICLEEVDDLMMIAIGVSTHRGDGVALDALHASNPPPIDGPLISVVSHLIVPL